MNVRAALAAAAAALAEVSATPRLDAELLMAHALGITREAMLLGEDRAVPHAFRALLARRLRHEPVAYITGTRAFWTIELAVGPGVLIPRADSETLLEAAVAHFVDHAPRTVLDLGTGPGTLLFAALAEWPTATGVGVDVSAVALGYARANADALGSGVRAAFQTGDWARGVVAEFDLVFANPPYIGTTEPLPPEVRAYEPALALFAGDDGLDAYRAIVPQLDLVLTAGGAAILEIGATQADAVTTLLVTHGFAVALRRDLAGHPRALIATRPA